MSCICHSLVLVMNGGFKVNVFIVEKFEQISK